MNFFPNAESILRKKDLDFRILLAYYKKYNKVEESHRKDLARIIVSSILEVDPDLRIEPASFRHLAKVIVEAFPCELAETYYVSSGGSKAPTGKLYSQYNNYKSKLNSVGLCTRRSKTIPNVLTMNASSSNQEQESVSSIECVEIKEEKFDDQVLNFNFNDGRYGNIDNYQFIERWNATYDERQEMLSQMSTIEYLGNFPYSLKSDVGYEIIIMDAERKFPNLCPDKSEIISRVTPLILMKLQNFRSEQMVANMLKKYEKENGQTQTLLALSLLPFLFTPTLFIKKRKFDASPPTKSDAYRSFFSNFESNVELQIFKTMMNSTKNSTSAKIYTIGKLNEDPMAVIQLTGGIEYIIEDAIKGFQVFFKLLCGLNLEYPSEAQGPWKFIERFLYDMEYTIDNINAQIRTYVNEFKTFSQTQWQKSKIHIICNLCSTSNFENAKSYISHYMDHQEKKEEETSEFICCGRIFGDVHSFGRHLNQNHIDNSNKEIY